MEAADYGERRPEFTFVYGDVSTQSGHSGHNQFSYRLYFDMETFQTVLTVCLIAKLKDYRYTADDSAVFLK